MKLPPNSPTRPITALFLCVSMVAACSSDPMSAPIDSADTSNAMDSADVTAEVIETLDEADQLVSTPAAPDIAGPSAALPTIDYAALITIAEETGPTSLNVSASARFYELATPLVDEPVLKPMTMLDTCEIGSESSQINATALDLPIDHLLEATGNEIFQITAISAGDTIEISSDAGSFVSLVKGAQATDIQYGVEEGAELNMTVPDALTININGDAFPQLQSAWTTPMRIATGLRDGVRSISNGSVLTWDAADNVDNGQSRVHIYAGFLDELSGQLSSYQCELADDGEFSLPADVQALYADGKSANFIDLARYSRRVQLVDGISVVSVFIQRF